MEPKQPGQGANWTTDIYSDGDSLWVGSPKGLYSFDTETGQFTRHYTEKDGLANNSIVGILGDALGNIWISTINGLSRFDPKTETFRNYDVFDGLQGNDFSPRSEAKTADNRMFFGGVNGLSAFYPDKVAYNPAPPPVVLTEFELFNKPAKVGGEHSPLQKAINVASSIVLRHDQSVFRIQFAALDFTAPQKNRYAYELEGFDKGWQYTDAASRFATYTNLDPGTYTFRVKASNNDGVWNEQGVALHLAILPAWYQTNWFRGACIAAFSIMIWGIHELRVRQLAAQFNMRLEERVAERTRIARDLHDTLLQSFQGLLLQFKAVSYQLQPGKTKSALDSAIGDASQAITEGRDTVQGLRASTIQKNDLAVAIRAIGEELASAEGSQSPPTIHVFVEGTPRNLHPILRDEVYRTAAEALRNAFHHAEAHQIEVELRYDAKDFKVRVRDDGKGIAPEILSSDGRKGHFGLHGMRERAKVAGGELAIWSEVDSGTEIELTIPASRAYTTSARRFWWFRKPPEKDADVKEKIES
jgi:signal transduction histidine kinase